MTQLGQPLTKAAIARLVGLTPTAYTNHPQARRILNQVTQQ